MQPTTGKVFVKAIKANSSKFELTGTDTFKVTHVGEDVTACKVGDFVLFGNYHEYEYKGEKFIKVDEQDIDGVCTTL